MHRPTGVNTTGGEVILMGVGLELGSRVRAGYCEARWSVRSVLRRTDAVSRRERGNGCALLGTARPAHAVLTALAGGRLGRAASLAASLSGLLGTTAVPVS